VSAPADDLGRSIDRLAEEHGFSGVVRVDDADRAAFSPAYGLAHRGHRVPNTLATRFAIASGTKGLTAPSSATPAAARGRSPGCCGTP
jgi:CubicO group peptidase (beta-lactamase class C family)